MSLIDAAHGHICKDQQQEHADNHDRPLQGVSVQHSQQAAEKHVHHGDRGKKQQGNCVVQAKCRRQKLGPTDHDCGRVQRHEQEDHKARENLDELLS